jgi:hypothetical protein
MENSSFGKSLGKRNDAGRGKGEGTEFGMPGIPATGKETPQLQESALSRSTRTENSPWTARVWETARIDRENAPTSASLREIDLRLPVDNQLIDVRLRERLGLLEVSVRTPDAVLAKEMRRELGDLVRSLESQGYEATPRPAESDLSTEAQHHPSGNPDSGSNGRSGEDSARGQRQGQRRRQGNGEDRRFSIDGIDNPPPPESGFRVFSEG